MTEKSGYVSQPVGLITMYGFVIFDERLFEQVCPHTVNLGESLSDETVELGVGLLLRTCFDDHGRQLGFLAHRQIDFGQLVYRFLRVHT